MKRCFYKTNAHILKHKGCLVSNSIFSQVATVSSQVGSHVTGADYRGIMFCFRSRTYEEPSRLFVYTPLTNVSDGLSSVSGKMLGFMR